MAEIVSSRPCKERDAVLALIAQRQIEPCSKLALSLRFNLSTVGADFGLPEDGDPSDTPLFAKGCLAEIAHPDFPGERLIDTLWNLGLRRTRLSSIRASRLRFGQSHGSGDSRKD